MDENLVGYALNCLEEDERRAVESALENDDQARRRLALLRQALEPLDADRDGQAPPRDLVVRTIARVAEHACRALPRAPRPLSLPLGPEPSWWRRPDLLVAACLLLAALGIAVPALFRGAHERAQLLECQNQLRDFGAALAAYHDQHRRYPDVSAHAPRDVAGMVVPILLQAGVIAKPTRLTCPSHPCQQTMPTLDELRNLNMDDFLRAAPNLNPCYAYNLGHYQGGSYCSPRQPDDPKRLALLPLMSDAPPPEGDPGNSPNHGGAGQNVLFQDGSVKFVKSRNVGLGGDDIFLNKAKKHAAGLDELDVVLGPSASKP